MTAHDTPPYPGADPVWAIPSEEIGKLAGGWEWWSTTQARWMPVTPTRRIPGDSVFVRRTPELRFEDVTPTPSTLHALIGRETAAGYVIDSVEQNTERWFAYSTPYCTMTPAVRAKWGYTIRLKVPQP